MYEVTACRIGKRRNRLNKQKKGTFKVRFSTLSELAQFMKNSRMNLYFPYILKELSRKELNILSDKFAVVKPNDLR